MERTCACVCAIIVLNLAAICQTTNRDSSFISYRYSIDVNQIADALRLENNVGPQSSKGTAYILLPFRDNPEKQFAVVESPVVESLNDYGTHGIRTFSGHSVPARDVHIKMNVFPSHVEVYYYSTERELFSMLPTQVPGDYIFSKHHRSGQPSTITQGGGTCQSHSVLDTNPIAKSVLQAYPCEMRSYRLAIATTGEFSNYHGSNSINGDVTPAAVVVEGIVNLLNLTYERELGIQFILTANQNQLIALDPSTDNFWGSISDHLDQAQAFITATIGANAYDVGHVLHKVNSTSDLIGLATLPSACNDALKARGATWHTNPSSSTNFVIDWLSHEIGHQFSGRHTFNNSCNGNIDTTSSVEVGSGMSILGYAGTCSPNADSLSLNMFGGLTLSQVKTYITSGTLSGCGTVTIGNSAPTFTVPQPDVHIPVGTPFMLTTQASDPGNSVSYSWEQMDTPIAPQPPQSGSTQGPTWKVKLPSSNGFRYFPEKSSVLNGTTDPWNVLPIVPRQQNFRVTVRDDHPQYGCIAQQDVLVTSHGTTPFRILYPNDAITIPNNEQLAVSWQLGASASPPISCSTVRIKLSINNGTTFDYILSNGTANDGLALLDLPNVTSDGCRILIESSDGVFYDINDEEFSIVSPSYVPDQSGGLSCWHSFSPSVSGGNFGCIGEQIPITFNVNFPAHYAFPRPVRFGTYNVLTGQYTGMQVFQDIPGNSSSVIVPPASVSNSYTCSTGLSQSQSASSYILTATTDLNVRNIGWIWDVNIDNYIAGEGYYTTRLRSGQAIRCLPPPTIMFPSIPNTTVFPGQNLEFVIDAYSQDAEIDIASDPDFNTIVESESLSFSEPPGYNYLQNTAVDYSPEEANIPGETYYFRMRVSNEDTVGNYNYGSYTVFDCDYQLVTMKVVTDGEGQEFSWSITDSAGTIVASGDGYPDGPLTQGAFAQPDQPVCLQDGCYTLNLYDDYGDGICCGWGQGYVELVDGTSGPTILYIPNFYTDTMHVDFCYGVDCEQGDYSETFDDISQVNWTNEVRYDDIQWFLNTGNTPSVDTGPTQDHTSGSGYYVYVEASTPNFPNKTAILHSPCIDLVSADSIHLDFWYHMYGANIGSLRLDIWDGSDWQDSVFYLSGNQGNTWYGAHLNISDWANGRIRLRFTGKTGSDYAGDIALDDVSISYSIGNVKLHTKVLFEGPYDAFDQRMDDALRATGLLPIEEPYSSIGYVPAQNEGDTISQSLYAISGDDAVVDWVAVELRQTPDSSVVAGRMFCVVTRTGEVRSSQGDSVLTFAIAPGEYYVAIRHRNHLAVISDVPFTFSSEIISVDFTHSSNTVVHELQSRKAISGIYVVVAGDINSDGYIKYTGLDNDRDIILQEIGGTIPTNVLWEYSNADVNMDGYVKYTGLDNDRDIILLNIGGTVPTSVVEGWIPY